MRLFLLRHGQTDWNVAHRLQGSTDIPLNRTGLKQAEDEAARLVANGVTFDTVYSSPLSRAKKTAQIVAGIGESALICDDRIGEMSFGEQEGRAYTFDPHDKANVEPDENLRNFAFHPALYRCPQGAESYEDVIARTGAFLRDLYARHADSDDRVLVVSHGAALHALLFNLLHRTDLQEYWIPRIANCHLMQVIEIPGTGAKIVSRDLLAAVLKGAAGSQTAGTAGDAAGHLSEEVEPGKRAGDLYIFGRDAKYKPDKDIPIANQGLVTASVDAGLRPDQDFTICGDLGADRILLLSEKEVLQGQVIRPAGSQTDEFITGNASVVPDGRGGHEALLPMKSGAKAVLSLISYPKMKVTARGFAPARPDVTVTPLSDDELLDWQERSEQATQTDPVRGQAEARSVESGAKAVAITVSDLPDPLADIRLSFWCTAGTGSFSLLDGPERKVPLHMANTAGAQEVTLCLSELYKGKGTAAVPDPDEVRLLIILEPSETVRKVKLPKSAEVTCIKRIPLR